MQTTRHIQQRMSQRGINRGIIDAVLALGRPDGDKFVMDRNEARLLLEQNQQEARVLKKILDKGGVTVVTEGDALITTYNCNNSRH